jgi:lipopolysaccharide export system protein LptC
MNRLYSLSAFVLFLCFITYSVIEWRSAQVNGVGTIDQQLEPDFIAESLASSIYNSRGKLSHIINAQRMEHYAALEFTHFEYPKYTLYPKNKTKPWKLSAKEATLYSNNRVILETRVRLVAADKNGLIQEINCKYLELDLNTNIITSDQTVMIQGKDFIMYGSGLIIDLNTTQMTLTEHVQTIYKKNPS